MCIRDSYYSVKAKQQKEDEDEVYRIAQVASQPPPPSRPFPPRPPFRPNNPSGFAPRPNNFRPQGNYPRYNPPFNPNRFQRPRFAPPSFMYDNEAFCWYHKMFGVRALKCKEPCVFITNPPKDVVTPIDTSKIQFLKM